MIQYEIKSKIVVTRNEIEDYYKKHKDEFVKKTPGKASPLIKDKPNQDKTNDGLGKKTPEEASAQIKEKASGKTSEKTTDKANQDNVNDESEKKIPDEVATQIADKLYQAQADEKFSKWISDLREQAQIKIIQ